MNSYKNSWERKRKIYRQPQSETRTYLYDTELRRGEFFNSHAYKAARQKAIRDKAYSYIVIGCTLVVIGILMLWP